MPRNRVETDRRTVLGAVGVGLTLPVAGCLGGGDSEENGNESQNGNESENGQDNGAEQLSDPVEVPEDEECAVCGMMPAEHPEWNAQLVHEDETRTHFCSSGCLAAYTVDPQRFDGPDSEIATAWATGYETGELVAAADASFVRVTNPDHVDDIMMMNPTPFADRSDAEAFVGQFDSYDETDIITYDEFDRDLAELYRAEFFDEG